MDYLCNRASVLFAVAKWVIGFAGDLFHLGSAAAANLSCADDVFVLLARCFVAVAVHRWLPPVLRQSIRRLVSVERRNSLLAAENWKQIFSFKILKCDYLDYSRHHFCGSHSDNYWTVQTIVECFSSDLFVFLVAEALVWWSQSWETSSMEYLRWLPL